MILRRLGNKKKIAKEIQKYFPDHRIYIEPFFGAGGMFFNKPKAHNNILNDNDSEVFNLFQVVSDKYNELLTMFKLMPYSQDLLEYWKVNEETNDVKKALRFLFLSNYTLLGTGSAIRLEAKKNEYASKFPLLLKKTSDMIYESSFANLDFRKFLKNIAFIQDGRNDEAKTFIYCDPPYLDTNDNYQTSFTEQDSLDLFDCLEAKGCKFAMSEFDHPFILEQAQKRGLNIIYIGERNNLKNRRVEILVTNYENRQQSLFA